MLARLTVVVVAVGLVILGTACGPAATSGAGSQASPTTAASTSATTDASAFATQLVANYNLSDVQRATVLDSNAAAAVSQPWLYVTVDTSGPAGLRAQWEALLLASAYRANAAKNGVLAISGWSMVPAGDQSCAVLTASTCDASGMSLQHLYPRDPSAWSTDSAATQAAIASRVRTMSGAKLVSVGFAKGVWAPLPDVTIQTSDPIAFAKEYKYGTVAALGDDAAYEGYILTVVDGNGDPVSVQAESDSLATGIGWSRSDVRSVIDAG
jgi:hypothetical protein